MEKIEAIIFDLDGTLIDSMGVWRKIDVDFLKKRGLKAPGDYFEAVNALGFRETANYTIKRFGLPERADDLMREWNEMAAYEYAHNIRLKPYVREYLDRLREGRVKTGIATSSPAVLCDSALKNNDIAGYFSVVCSADEAERGKEFPDVFILTAEKMSVSPEKCLVFEDTLTAIRSAKKAGMSVWGVYDDSSKNRLEEIKAISDGFLYDFRDAPIPGRR
jgi:HAD superfamily hydrolase (TIGR01509 family)